MAADARPAATDRLSGAARRAGAAWRNLGSDQRLAAIAALALFGTMLLPWYSTTSRGKSNKVPHSGILTLGWIEFAILLVSLGVLALLFARAERRPFHLPGGDGTVVMAAGAWVGVLFVWRLFDRPSFGGGVAVELSWGIFFAWVAAGVLTYAGSRIRAAHRLEPPLPVPQTEERRPPSEIRLPEERPHLAETQVLPDRGPPADPPPPPPPRRPAPEPPEQPRIPGMPD
jgi:hypothetical protein